MKICGITRTEDAVAAALAGADAIGLNFVGGPRELSAELATEILKSLPPLVTPVALVRLEHGRIVDWLLELLGQFWVSHLQLYGSATPEDLAMLARDGFRPMPVVTVSDDRFADRVQAWLPNEPAGRPHAIVLDAFDANRAGGTGQTFRWDWVPAARQAGRLDRWPPIILAGGLSPDNVAEAIRVVQPYGVDVSSGVEVAGSPGVKDPIKMRDFIRQAKSAVVAATG